MARHGNQSGELLGTQALEPGIQAHTLSPLLIMGGSSVEATSLLPVSSLLPPLCWGNGDRGPPSACLNGWKVDRRDSAASSSSPLPLLHHHHRHHCNVLPPTAPALPLPLPLPPPPLPPSGWSRSWVSHLILPPESSQQSLGQGRGTPEQITRYSPLENSSIHSFIHSTKTY